MRIDLVIGVNYNRMLAFGEKLQKYFLSEGGRVCLITRDSRPVDSVDYTQYDNIIIVDCTLVYYRMLLSLELNLNVIFEKHPNGISIVRNYIEPDWNNTELNLVELEELKSTYKYPVIF